jgi:hypothetical protein
MEDIEEGPGLIEPPTLFSKAFMGIGDEFPFQEDLLKVIGQKDDIAAREELIAQIKDKPKSVNILYPDENCDSTRLVFFNRTGEFLEMIDLGKGIASQETITKKAASIGNTRGRVMLVGYNWKSEVRKMQVKEVGKIPMRDIFEPLLQKTLFGDNGEALEELKEEGFIKLEHKNYKEQRLLAFHFENYGHEKKRLLESTLKEMMKSMEPSTEDEERWQLSYKSALKIFGIESGIKALSRFFIKDSQSGNYTINWEEVEKASFIYDICVIVSKASKVTASSYELCTLYYRQLILTSGGKGGSYKARKKNNASISF